MLTPHCSAASGMVMSPSIASITCLRKSSEYGFAIHAGLLPAGILNHIRTQMGIPRINLFGKCSRTAQRLTNLIAVFCILSWRVFWMTMLNRSAPDALPTLALTATEIAVLDRVVSDKSRGPRKTLSHYLTKIARLGGY